MAEVTLQDLDRRLAELEGWRSGQGDLLRSLREDVRELRSELAAFQLQTNQRFAALEENVNQRFAALEENVNRRFADLEARLTASEDNVNRRFADVDRRLASMDDRIAALGHRIDVQTRWIVGLQFLTLVTLIAALLRLVT